jgi:hypothetical protein
MADEGASPAMVLVLDASGSMNESDGRGSTKIVAAKSAMKTIIGQLPKDLRVGLRVYGHRVPSRPDHAKACQDTELVAPVTTLDGPGLSAAVDRFAAKGETPIGLSLQKAAADLPAGSAGSVVLVSDGEDSCAPPSPCDVAKKLKASGVKLTVDTVGLRVDAKARAELTCIAQATGGTYTDVADTGQLTAKLSAVTEQAARVKRTTTGGGPVEGATTISDAPKIGNGRSTDSIVMGETLYYAVDVAPGKAVTARMTIDATKATEGNGLARGGMHLKWVDAEGHSIDTEYENAMQGKVTVKGVSIKAGDEATEAQTAYLAIDLEDWKPGTELPLVIDLQGAAEPAASGDSSGAGDSQDSSSASPGESTSPSADEPSSQEGTEDARSDGAKGAEKEPAGESDEGFSMITLVASCVVSAFLGLLIGAGTGYVGGSRSARRSRRSGDTTNPMPYPPPGPYRN